MHTVAKRVGNGRNIGRDAHATPAPLVGAQMRSPDEES